MDRNHVFSEKEAGWLFGENVTSLQELAAFQYVWNLWSNIMLSGKYHNIKSKMGAALVDTCTIALKFIKRLKLGPVLENILRVAVFDVKYELVMWINYNLEQMLSGRKITLYTCHLKYIVFKSNMKLDYEGSARKLMSYQQVDEVTAFEIMCRFCMEDELHRLPKDEVKGFLKKIKFHKRPLAWYWICYLTDDKEALRNVGEAICAQRGKCCLERSMLTFKDVNNWPNVKWFLQHLCGENDQMKGAVEVLADFNRRFLRDFYYVLNENQWRYVFHTAAVDILSAFFLNFQKFEQGCFVWKRLRDSMTVQQFVELMRGLTKPREKILKSYSDTALLWNTAIDRCKNDILDYENSYEKHLKSSFSTTTMLWNTAPDRFKNHVLEAGNSIVIDNFFDSSFIRRFDNNLQFLFELLNFASAEYRERMILTHGDVLFQVYDFSKIEKIVELCLPNASQRDQFERFLAESKMIEDRCQELFVNGDFTLLNKFFESFCPNESVVNDYRKRLLSSEKTCEAFIFEPNKWRDFEKFVGGSVDSNSPLYTVVRDQVLRSCKLAHFNDWSNIEQLDHLEKVVVQLFNQEELVKLKTKISDELQDMLNNFFTTFTSAEGKFFTAEFLRKFVSWLNGNDEGFKSKLPVDSIFVCTITNLFCVIRFDDLVRNVHERLLINSKTRQIDTKILVALDEFLKWYFGGFEQAEKYKLAIMTITFSFDDAFYQEFKKTAEVDEDVDILLAWMFENDEEVIRTFKANCDYEDVLKMSSMLSL
ncbi:uncharacterized protein LOC135850085 isoform X2 [Planococcus citri]|uniref:uncharacterized protein LOC135850085 isoform X2 n=1 Tax=Planococcus citri TaxID=170843 RepID=UPI0031F751EE